MKKFRRQMVSGVLALSMLATMLPMSAFAANDNTAEEDAPGQYTVADDTKPKKQLATDEVTLLENEIEPESVAIGAITRDAAVVGQGSCGSSLSWTEYSDRKLVISGYGYMENYDPYSDLDPPWSDNINEVEISTGVKNIGSYAFAYSKYLENVTIPDSVISIGDSAFRSCTNLKSITIPDGVSHIGDSAFISCKNLTSIIIPDKVSSINDGTFEFCENLTSITIPDDVTSIGVSAFGGCTNLKSIVLPDSIDYIGYAAFLGCESLTHIKIPEGVTNIQISTFGACTKLKSVAFPKSLTTIEVIAFRSCDSLTDIYYNGSEEDWAAINIDYSSQGFYSNDCLRNATMHYNGTGPDGICGDDLAWHIDEYGVLTISGSAKMYDYDASSNLPPWNHYKGSITGIVLEEGVSSVGDYAFSGCDKLKRVIIPDGVTSIGDYAFSDCYSLTDVYYGGSEEKWVAISIGYCNETLTGATIHYNSVGAAEEVGAGKCGENLTWTLDASGTLTISGTGAMDDYQYGDETPWYAYYKMIESVVIEDGVTTIGNSAFEAIQAREILIGNSVQFIGSYVFSVGSGSAMVIEFSGSAPKISLQAFLACGDGLIDIYYNPTTGGWENVINQEYELADETIISWIFSDNAADKLPISDRLSFSNAEEYFGGEENGYFITQDDYDRLTSNLKWSERISLISLNVNGTEWFPKKWSGSCYGMSELVALGRLGIINPSDVQSSAQTMFEVEQGNMPLSKSTQSLINFYFIQQKIPVIKSVRSEFMKKSQVAQISQMEQCISSAEQEGRTALIGFKYYSKKLDKDISHAVLGYAIERGTFKLSINNTKYQFDRRVLICDPNTAGDQQLASTSALYYNDTQWAMIGDYNVVSTSNDLNTNSINDTAQLLIVTSDPDYINAIDYKTGDRNYTENTKNAFLNVLADFFVLENSNTHTQYSISKGRFDGTNTINDEMVIIGNIDASSDTEQQTIISIPLDNTYMVKTDEQDVAVSMTYENLYLSASSEASGAVTFDPKGEIHMVTSTPASGSLSLTANDGHTTVPWNVVTVEAADVQNFSLSQTEKGIILEGDNLKDTTVYGTNDEETVELNFGTEEQKVLITSKEDEDQLLIMKDTDNDGNFETPLDIINVTSVSLNKQSATLEVRNHYSLQLQLCLLMLKTKALTGHLPMMQLPVLIRLVL